MTGDRPPYDPCPAIGWAIVFLTRAACAWRAGDAVEFFAALRAAGDEVQDVDAAAMTAKYGPVRRRPGGGKRA